MTGLPQEIIERLCKKNGCVGHIEDATGYASSVTPFDAETLKLVLDEMAQAYDVDVLLHAVLVDVRKDTGSIQAVLRSGCSGGVSH